MATDLKSFKPHNDEDRFGSVMKEFLEQAKEQRSVLVEINKKMEGLYENLGKYFAFAPSKYTIELCFADLKTFKDQYKQAVAENIARRQLEEKNRRAKEAKEKAEKERKERASNKIDPFNTTSENEQGLMEHLLSSINSGQAFALKRRTRKNPTTPQGKSL